MGNIRSCRSYFSVLGEILSQMRPDVIDEVALELLKAYKGDRNVFILGNGGSAATASHFACDLAKGVTKYLPTSAKRFRTIALTDNVAVMTAWANDTSYENIFSEQLRSLVRERDVVVAISGSGNSPNVLKALNVANLAGATIIGLTGCMGGKMLRLCHHRVIVPSDNIEVIEDLHLAVCHSVSTVLRTWLTESRGERREILQVLEPAPYCQINYAGNSGIAPQTILPELSFRAISEKEMTKLSCKQMNGD